MTQTNLINLLLFFSILFFLSLFVTNAFSIFYFTDTIYAWNHWVKMWALNGFPTSTSHYPQLFSSNLSLGYILVGDLELEYIIKIVMPLFPLSIVLIFYDISNHEKKSYSKIGGLIYSLVLIILYGIIFITDGNADIPVTFLGFLTFYAIITSSDKLIDTDRLIIISIFAASAVNTKMAGIFVLMGTGIWLLHYFYTNRKLISEKRLLKELALVVTVLLLSLFWYFIKPAEMAEGIDQSSFLDPNLITRFIKAIKMLYLSFGPPLTIFFVLTLVAGFKVQRIRIIILLIIIPILTAWAFLFSYDFRNISILFPFIAYCSGYGVVYIINFLGYNKSFLNVSRKYFNLIPVISIFIFIVAANDNFIKYGVKFATQINRIYFLSYRVVYTVELGYYKYVEYYQSTLIILSFFLMFIYIFKKIRARISLIIVSSIMILFFANYYITEAFLKENQETQKQAVDIHNLYYMLYPKIDKNEEITIYTNIQNFAELIPPGKSKFIFMDFQDKITLPSLNGNSFILIDRSELELNNNHIKSRLLQDQYSIEFDDGNRILYKLL